MQVPVILHLPQDENKSDRSQRGKEDSQRATEEQERITRPPWIQNARPCLSDAWDEQDKMRKLAVWYNTQGRSVMVLGTFRRRPMSRRFKSQGTLKWQVQVSKGSKKSTRSRQAADDAILDRSTALDDLRCIFLLVRRLLGTRLSKHCRCVGRKSEKESSS
jgi:hypothetical protein